MPKKYDSGIQDFVTGDATAEVVSALSGAMQAGEWSTFTLEIWLRALTAAKVRIGVQFSNNPMEFTATARELFSINVTANGWTRGATVYDLFNVASATPAAFFRFVALGLNTTGALAGGGQIRIVARPIPLNVFRRLPTGQVKPNTKASDSTSASTPATAAFETAGIVEHRATMEVVGISGPMKLQPSAQETNTPDDDTSWVSVGLLGTEVSAVGTTFPTVFIAVAYTKRYGRYVINAKNDTGGTDVECATARLIVEARG